MQLLKQKTSACCEDTVVQPLCDQRTNEFEVQSVFDGVVECTRRFDTPEAALPEFCNQRTAAVA